MKYPPSFQKGLLLGTLFAILGTGVYVGLGFLSAQSLDYFKLVLFLVVYGFLAGLQLGSKTLYKEKIQRVRALAYVYSYVSYFFVTSLITFVFTGRGSILNYTYFEFLFNHYFTYYVDRYRMGSYWFDLLQTFVIVIIAVNIFFPKPKKTQSEANSTNE